MDFQSSIMRRRHRSLAASSSCSDVTTCLSEGSTECTLGSETCPPCVYALTGGDFSCYSRDTSGACPFSGTYAECDSTSTAATSTTSSTSSSTAGDSTKTTAPTGTTKTPTTTTKTTTKTTTAPGTATSTSSSSKSNSKTTTSDGASTSSSTVSSSSSDPSQTSKSKSTTSSASNSGESAMTANTSETGSSPLGVNLALIGGAVVLVVIVLIFIARRVTKRRKSQSSQNRMNSTPSEWSDETGTMGTGDTADMYSTYSYKDSRAKGRSGNGLILLESKAANSFGPAHNERSTADFSNFGGNSQYDGDSQYSEDSRYVGDSQYDEDSRYGANSRYAAGDSQYYSEYGVSTGPEVAAPNTVATNHHFVDITATPTARASDMYSVRSGQKPLTVSQLHDPMAIGEDDEEYYESRRGPAAMPQYEGYEGRVVPPPPAYPPSSRRQGGFAMSNASSIRSDYDIVDPTTMHDVEQRDTELLMEDSRYPKFSFESETDIYDRDSGDSSDEEVDEHGRRRGERMI